MSLAAQKISPGRIPYTWRRLHARATAWPPWSRTTSFGRPVVPLVESTWSGAVASTGTQSAGAAEAASARQSRSRFGRSDEAASARDSTTTRSGGAAASASTPSTSGWYATVRPGSRPHDAVSRSFGRASSMRLASARAAKPPNTTECTAPSRAQAGIATTDSGTIGMWISTRSPRPTPRAARAPAKRAVPSRSVAWGRVRTASVMALSQTPAGGSPRPAATWRSSALWHVSTTPPGNQRTNGAPLASHTRAKGRNQSIAAAASAQKPSGSASEQACRSSWRGMGVLRRAEEAGRAGSDGGDPRAGC
jgi:hypothetical protein